MSNPRTDVEREIAALGPWFHNLHLPGGVQTAPDHPLGDFPRYKWQHMEPCVPRDLSGCCALDIGCNAGFYSFELARRGANVVAIDTGQRYLSQASWAAHKLGVQGQVRFEQMDVYDLARLKKRFDLVLFLGVFYHLRHPLLGLDIVTSVTDSMLFFQTLTMPQQGKVDCPENITIMDRDLMLESSWPKMAFVEHCLEGDPTNWWVPNRSAIEAMLRSCGWSAIEYIGEEIYHCRNRSADPPADATPDTSRAISSGI